VVVWWGLFGVCGVVVLCVVGGGWGGGGGGLGVLGMYINCYGMVEYENHITFPSWKNHCPSTVNSTSKIMQSGDSGVDDNGKYTLCRTYTHCFSSSSHL